ncbi:hypothetical protein [Mycolicibacterium sp. XJ1819]
MSSSRSPRDHITAVVTAHGALTDAVAEAADLMRVHGRREYAAHLDHHRAELNVAIGELALWLESFGDHHHVDLGDGLHPTGLDAGVADRLRNPFELELLHSREALKARRASLLAELATARAALHLAGLPADEMTAYRRVIRLWAGEAIDVVAAVHRLALADRYIRRLGGLHAHDEDTLRRDGAALLRQWMQDLEKVDRDGELALAESCGYGELVEWYRAEAV